MKLVLISSTLISLLPLAFATGGVRSAYCEPSLRVIYDFEDFEAGDTIASLGNGDITVFAKRISKDGDTSPAVPMALDTADPGDNLKLETRDLGMVLIVSKDDNAMKPMDNHKGGVFTFKFNRENAVVNEILILDAQEGGSIKVFKKYGTTKTFRIPKVTRGGRVSVRMSVRGVKKMVVRVKATGAVSWLDVEYCGVTTAPTVTPTVQPTEMLLEQPSASPSFAPSDVPSSTPSSLPIPSGCFRNGGDNVSDTLYQVGKDALAAALPALTPGRLYVNDSYMAAGDGTKLYFPIRDSYNVGRDAVMVVEDGVAIGFYRLTSGSGRYYSTCVELQTIPHYIFQFSGQSTPLQVDSNIGPPFPMSHYLSF